MGKMVPSNHQGLSERIRQVLILCIQMRLCWSLLAKLAVKPALTIVSHTGTNSKTLSTAPVPTSVMGSGEQRSNIFMLGFFRMFGWNTATTEEKEGEEKEE